MKELLSKIRNNWQSGFTVALVSIPLSISLAVASGVPPTIGIITAIWAGLIASIFGGSNFNIVGPTGALSGLIALYAVNNGSNGLASLAIVSGIFIILAFVFKLERYLIFIPSTVINGFTLGVALIIGFSQFNAAFGLYDLPKHERFFLNTIESFRHITDFSIPTLAMFIVFLSAQFVLRHYYKKIPGAIVVSFAGIGLGYLTSVNYLNLDIATLGSVYGDLSLKLITVPQFIVSKQLFISAAAVALVAILETMLSAKIADVMTRTKHNERKEMLGLGLANIASGLAGGIPATAALARTSLNIKAGANSRISATISAIFLTVISFLLLSYFQYIPMAVIAAILVYVAIQMIESDHFIRYYRYQKSGFWLSMLVAAITFYEDPIIGIVIGAAAALLMLVEKLSHGHFDLKLNKLESGLVQTISGDSLEEVTAKSDVLLYSIKGKFVYLNSRAHVDRFESNLLDFKIIILRLRSVYFIDMDGARALDEIVEIVKKREQVICLTSVNDNVVDMLELTSYSYGQLKKEGLIFKKSEEALNHFGIKT